MPKELVCVEAGKVDWREYAEPDLEPGCVRVQCAFAAEKHGTMLAYVKGYGNERGWWDAAGGLFREGGAAWDYPVPLGNMAVGDVVEVGAGVGDFAVGDRVCLHAGFRPTAVAAAAACWKLPSRVAWESAVCLDPAEYALVALRDGDVRLGDAVAVFGMGAIGLMCVRMAKLAGASLVAAVEPVAERRAAAEAMGADLVVDPGVEDAGLNLREATGLRGVDVSIEYSGAVAAMQAALRAVAFGGTVVAGAYPPPYPAGLDLGAEAHRNRPNLVFSRACSDPNRDHPRWDESRVVEHCRRLVEDGSLTGEPVVGPIVPFDELADSYLELTMDPGRSIKLGVRF